LNDKNFQQLFPKINEMHMNPEFRGYFSPHGHCQLSDHDVLYFGWGVFQHLRLRELSNPRARSVNDAGPGTPMIRNGLDFSLG